MFGSSNPVIEPLISQAVLGTSFKGSVDLSFLPEPLQQTAKSIQASSSDQEDCLFKIASMLISQDQTATALEHNSFSLEQMRLYQQAVATDFSALKKSKKSANAKSAQTLETPEESSSCEAVSSDSPQTQSVPNSQETPSAQSTPLDQTTAKAILNEVKKHKGPMPLPQVPHDKRPVFSKSVEILFEEYPSSLDDYKVLIFQTFQQLASCNMRFSERFFFKLAAFFDGAYRTLDYHFSSVMCQELIIKCGGPSFLYVLPFYMPKVKSIFFYPANSLQRNVPVYRVGDYVEGSISGYVEGGDWLELFQKANKKDALGLLIKLRHDNPDLALNLLSTCALKFKPDSRAELINALRVNLSLADEPFLVEMVRDSQSVPCTFAAKGVLEELHGSQYAQSCAQIVREHLHYEATKGQWVVEPIYPKDSKITALGITVPKFASNTATNECLQQLLHGMDWEDLRDLTGATELKEVFVAWEKLDLFKSYELNMPSLLAIKIFLARDKQAAQSFVKFYTGKISWIDSTARIFMLLEGQERYDALKSWRSYNLCPDWCVELDGNTPLYKEHYMEESWLKAIVEACLENASESMENNYMSRLFEVMSPKCLTWLSTRFDQVKAELGAIQDEHAQVVEKIDNLATNDRGYKELIYTSQELSFKRRMWLNKVYVVGSLLYILTFKNKVAEVLEKELESHAQS